jgi:steroid 5-alpha reductase family enzyme
MSAMTLWLLALSGLLVFGIAGWLVSLLRKDVSIVDSMWSLMFLIAAVIYMTLGETGPRATLIVTLVAIWALRLAGHITWRNWGEGEDYRYQKIRANNSPGFAFKSIYIVFGLQAGLAAIISLPLLAAIGGTRSMGALDVAAVLVWIVGFVFEALGDLQLAQFRSNPDNKGRVLQSGLWSLTRHPNYFGDFCIWWGFYLFALSAGGWWTILAPLLMSFLLLKVSGVAMLERDIGKRRPEYAAYVEETNTFFPGPRKKGANS